MQPPAGTRLPRWLTSRAAAPGQVPAAPAPVTVQPSDGARNGLRGATEPRFTVCPVAAGGRRQHLHPAPCPRGGRRGPADPADPADPARRRARAAGAPQTARGHHRRRAGRPQSAGTGGARARGPSPAEARW
jgi:hypothetical protein